MPGLRGCDAGFLYVESADQPITVPFLAVLSPRAGHPDAGPLTPAALRAHLAARLHDLPSLRWRLARAPLGLARPFFVDDPDFDLDFHLRYLTADPPGGPAELDRIVAAGAERHLDRRHPLWQLALIDGLADGRQALYLRIHHALADGAAIRTLFGHLFVDEPTTAGVGAGAELPSGAVPGQTIPGLRVRADRRGERKAIREEALADGWRCLKQLPSLAADTKRRMEAVKAHEEASPITVPALTKDTPVCSINDAFSGGRVYARAEVPLADVLAVKRAAGVPVDVVVLALAGAALRRYLLAHDDLPERPLTANVPMGTDAPDAPARTWGNGFANYLATLATDEPDPWQRLLTIGTVAEESRRRLAILGTDTIVRWLDYVPEAIGGPGGRRMGRYRRDHPEKIDFSVLVSNVPGPRQQLAFGPVQIDEMYISGPTTDGEGVNITSWGYRDRVALAVLAHTAALASPTELVADMVLALDELVALARDHAGASQEVPA